MVRDRHARRASLEEHRAGLKAIGALCSPVNRALNWLKTDSEIHFEIAERAAAGLPTNELEDELRIRAARAVAA